MSMSALNCGAVYLVIQCHPITNMTPCFDVGPFSLHAAWVKVGELPSNLHKGHGNEARGPRPEESSSTVRHMKMMVDYCVNDVRQS